MDCLYEIIGTADGVNLLKCKREGCRRETRSEYGPKMVHTMCRVDCPRSCTGTILHGLLASKLGVSFELDCCCKEWLMKMNKWGPEGCRKNLSKIVGALLSEAARREWKLEGRPVLSKVACVGTRCSLGKKFARRWARKLVLEAIERCSAET